MKPRPIICIALCLLAWTDALAQLESRIAISDCATGLPLNYGVLLDSLDENYYALPDENGCFNVPALGARQLYLSAPGIHSALDSLGPDTYCVHLDDSMYPAAEVKGFSQKQSWLSTAAPVARIHARELRRTDMYSLQPALNAIAGVSMDSRGNGGSHRLNIRGSAFRSPFAVRNIKMYLDGYPLTGPDGQTPLEMADAADIAEIEILKGPSGSLYGSANGGVIHFQTFRPQPMEREWLVNFQCGTGTSFRGNISTLQGFKNGGFRISLQTAENPGYRRHESNFREQAMLSGYRHLNENHKISGLAMWYYGSWDLPGGLTYSQAEDDPTQAVEYSVTQQAHVDRKRAMAGAEHLWQKSSRVRSQEWRTNVYGYFTQKVNPFGTSAFNQGYKEEAAPGAGMRSQYQFRLDKNAHKLSVSGALELQWEDYSIEEFVNASGQPGELKYRYDIGYLTNMLATAGDYWWRDKVNVYLGISTNQHAQDITGEIPLVAVSDTSIQWQGLLLPRVSLGARITPTVFAFVSYGKGNNVPNVFEIIDPLTYHISPKLSPETSENLEGGLKWFDPDKKMQAELSLFTQRTPNAITANTDSIPGTGETFVRYINNGILSQKGLEWQIAKSFVPWNSGPLFRLWATGTVYRFTLTDFHDENQDYSGAKMPGILGFSVNSGLSVVLFDRVNLAVYHYWQDRQPLNNLNTDWAPARHVINAALNLDFTTKRFHTFHFGVGANNLTSTAYTSFFQFNAPGGRYYNPVAPINGFFRLGWSWAGSRQKQ